MISSKSSLSGVVMEPSLQVMVNASNLSSVSAICRLADDPYSSEGMSGDDWRDKSEEGRLTVIKERKGD